MLFDPETESTQPPPSPSLPEAAQEQITSYLDSSAIAAQPWAWMGFLASDSFIPHPVAVPSRLLLRAIHFCPVNCQPHSTGQGRADFPEMLPLLVYREPQAALASHHGLNVPEKPESSSTTQFLWVVSGCRSQPPAVLVSLPFCHPAKELAYIYVLVALHLRSSGLRH